MTACSSCGDPLGTGPSCARCDHPSRTPLPLDDWRTDTAERPAVVAPPPPPAGPPPVVPPPALFSAPPAARYPLYADEPATPPPSDPVLAAAPVVPPQSGSTHRGRHGALVWAVGALTIVALAVTGGLLLLGGPGDDTATDTSTEQDLASTRESEATPVPTPSSPATDEPEKSQGSQTSPRKQRKESVDLARLAAAVPPATAPPSRDVRGNAVRYQGFNMLDGVPASAWRMPGDGSGTEVLITLDERTTLSRVGLVNGYAKRELGYDGYLANRRVTEVSWSFDDGTVVDQSLVETRDMQGVDIREVTTRTIRLRLVDVTAPGRGRSGRDFTAISDVTLVGVPS